MNNAALDVAAGLILMYLTLSLFCTFINELITTVYRLRARTLERALSDIIDVPPLKADFYRHGLIEGNRAANPNPHISYLSGRNFALGLLASLNPKKTLPTFESITGYVQMLPDSNIRDIIAINMVTAEGDICRLCDNLAGWFDQAMDRVSGAYNRKLRLISLLTGMILATAINADTIEVSQSLWHDGTLRARTLATSTNIASLGHYPTVTDIIRSENELRPLPLGWNLSDDEKYPCSHLLIKISGLFMTGLALSLGAHFWFDLLAKCVHIRGTGNKPDILDVKSSLAN